MIPRNFGRDANRTLVAPYIEDIWQVTQAVTVNAGVRLDYYSDSGDSLNPRLGSCDDSRGWKPLPRLNLTALTFELGLTAHPIERLFTRITLFNNQLEDLIDVPAGVGQFENIGSLTSRGVELEARWEWDSGASISGNYSYVDAKLEDGRPAPDEPRNIASLIAWTPMTARLGGGLSLYWQDASPRAAGDPRSDLSGCTVLDLNLIYRWSEQVQLGLAAYNLLDEDYALPAPVGTIAEDYGVPGRSVRAELRMAF